MKFEDSDLSKEIKANIREHAIGWIDNNTLSIIKTILVSFNNYFKKCNNTTAIVIKNKYGFGFAVIKEKECNSDKYLIKCVSNESEIPSSAKLIYLSDFINEFQDIGYENNMVFVIHEYDKQDSYHSINTIIMIIFNTIKSHIDKIGKDETILILLYLLLTNLKYDSKEDRLQLDI